MNRHEGGRFEIIAVVSLTRNVQHQKRRFNESRNGSKIWWNQSGTNVTRIFGFRGFISLLDSFTACSVVVSSIYMRWSIDLNMSCNTSNPLVHSSPSSNHKWFFSLCFEIHSTKRKQMCESKSKENQSPSLVNLKVNYGGVHKSRYPQLAGWYLFHGKCQAKNGWWLKEYPYFNIWVSINGGYPNGSFIMENHIKMDDLDSQKWTSLHQFHHSESTKSRSCWRAEDRLQHRRRLREQKWCGDIFWMIWYM